MIKQKARSFHSDRNPLNSAEQTGQGSIVRFTPTKVKTRWHITEMRGEPTMNDVE